jgi:hypothetical protein
VGGGHHHAARPRQYHSAERNRTQHVRIRRLDRVSCSFCLGFALFVNDMSSELFFTLDVPRRRRSLLSQPTSVQHRWSTICLQTMRCSKSLMRNAISSMEATSKFACCSLPCLSPCLTLPASPLMFVSCSLCGLCSVAGIFTVVSASAAAETFKRLGQKNQTKNVGVVAKMKHV